VKLSFRGLCAAKRFLHQGANVVIVDLNTSKAESDPELLPFIEAGAVVFQLANVTKEEDVAAYNAKALERYGRVDITVLSAGICHEVSEWIHLPLKTVQKSFDVNVRGGAVRKLACGKTHLSKVWLGIKHGAKAMLRDLSPNADRNFVLLSSVAGLGGRPKLACGFVQNIKFRADRRACFIAPIRLPNGLSEV
jgi:NAD(P)-dependent dehydrogenase (short-subunit alcohol dehydrogenase family)